MLLLPELQAFAPIPAVISSESSRSGNDIVVLLKVLEAVKGDVLIICSEE